MRDVVVVKGTRGPEARTKAREAHDKKALNVVAGLIAADPKKKKPGPVDNPDRVAYQSRAGMYMLTLEAPSDTFDPGSGKRTVHRGITWKFRNGTYVSTNPAEQAIAESKPSYGLNGYFWRAADAAKADVQRAVKQLIATVKGAPESVQRDVIAALAAEGDAFKLPVIEENPDEEVTEPAEATPETEQ